MFFKFVWKSISNDKSQGKKRLANCAERTSQLLTRWTDEAKRDKSKRLIRTSVNLYLTWRNSCRGAATPKKTASRSAAILRWSSRKSTIAIRKFVPTPETARLSARLQVTRKCFLNLPCRIATPPPGLRRAACRGEMSAPLKLLTTYLSRTSGQASLILSIKEEIECLYLHPKMHYKEQEMIKFWTEQPPKIDTASCFEQISSLMTAEKHVEP